MIALDGNIWATMAAIISALSKAVWKRVKA